jgi:hypothetical protein
MVYQDAAHDLCGYGKKMCAALPVDVWHVDQPQIGFIDRGGSLQRMAGTLDAHIAARKTAQFFIPERHQAIKRLPIALTPADEELNDFAWRRLHHSLDRGSADGAHHSRTLVHGRSLEILQTAIRLITGVGQSAPAITAEPGHSPRIGELDNVIASIGAAP